MGLAEIQSALAWLYTDAAARAQLLADQQAFGARFGLSHEETKAMAENVQVEVEKFACSLLRKRFNETTRALPQARRILGQKLFGIFERYACETGPATTRDPTRDGLAFDQWLLTNTLIPQTALEKNALRYEIAWLTMQHGTRRFLILWLPLPDRSPFRSLVMWFRWKHRLHYWHAP